jgi:hypothetical protein
MSWLGDFPIGFYSNPHPLWTPKNMALTPFTTNLKTLGSTRNMLQGLNYYISSECCYYNLCSESTLNIKKKTCHDW